ncbi:MAG: mechanosensitive ion channel family protein [Chloroflexaceae bacterium]|jgi:small-conductance mechanosensitive channel|nr:mechanosensitive ion channel family protein [Chloroflexaceae bacterium]
MIDPLLRSWEALLASVVAWLPQVLAALLILLITLFVASRLTGVVGRLLGTSRLPRNVHRLAITLTRLGVVVLGVIFALQALGFGQAVLNAVASLGVVGLVLSFALQDITKQFAAGVLLLVTRPFEVGDHIRIGANAGTVMDVQLRATVLKTDDGDEVIIPNADVYTATITNTSRHAMRRYRLSLELPPHAAPDAARAALSAAAATIPGVATEPAPSVVATGISEGNLTLELRYWIARTTPDHEAIVTEVLAVAQTVMRET